MLIKHSHVSLRQNLKHYKYTEVVLNKLTKLTLPFVFEELA